MGWNTYVTKEEEDTIIKLYKENVPVKDIVTRTKRHMATVMRIRKKYNIETRTKNNRLSKEQITQIKLLRKEGLNYLTIAKKTGLAGSTVGKHLKGTPRGFNLENYAFKVADKQLIHNEKYSLCIHHLRMLHFVLAYIITIKDSRRNIFSLPSTGFGLLRLIQKTQLSYINDRYYLAERDKGITFEVVQEVSKQFNTQQLWNEEVRDIIPEFPYDFFHFMFLDFTDKLSTVAREIIKIINSDCVKVGGRLSITTSHRDDYILSKFWKEHKNYRDITKDETENKLGLIQFFTDINPGYEVIACETFKLVTNTIIERKY